MRIKHIILRGFKSYGNKTVLKDLDLNLNCITGYNGSGKSNILDGICFVLGLQSFSLARVEKLQEFIYKNGQSGITEAEVSIVFTDLGGKFRDYPGMGNKDELTVTRIIKHDKSKYTLNGKKVTLSSIKKLFKSIGLNMDNPNSFFVKQGTVSNIVNFKPKELLELVEECARVNYFNSTRNYFDRAINKQDTKISHIEKAYDEELEPEIVKLKKEMDVLGQFNHSSLELKILTWNCKKLNDIIVETDIQHLQEQFTQSKDEMSGLKHNLRAMEASRQNLQQQHLTLETNFNAFSEDHNAINAIKKNKKSISEKESIIEILKNETIKKTRTKMESLEMRIQKYNQIIADAGRKKKLNGDNLEEMLDSIELKKNHLNELKRTEGTGRGGTGGKPITFRQRFGIAEQEY